MTITRDPVDLKIEQMREASVVAIDGDEGSGKTQLAAELQKNVGGDVISIDDFLIGNGMSYTKQFNANAFRACLKDKNARPLIIEGVLLLDILEREHLTADRYIFAKCIQQGQWQYEQYRSATANLPKSKLTREIAEYYRRRKPFERADVLTVLRYSGK